MSDNPEFKKDDERSTWWSSHRQQNKKFVRWIQNELIRDSIYELVKVGALDANATDRKIELVIEELVNLIYQEDQGILSQIDDSKKGTIKIIK